MTEARAVSLVLGAVALVTFALAASLVTKSLLRKRSGSGVSGAISRAFFASASSSATKVAGIDSLLPKGTPEAQALRDLAADDFACTFEPRAATCFRSVGAGRATDIWTIWLTFDDASKITTSQGERRSARP